MSDTPKIQGLVRDLLDPAVIDALERAILDDAYAGKEQEGKISLLQFAAISSLPDGNSVKGRMISDIYNANPSAFSSLSAWSKELRTQAGVMPALSATSSYARAARPPQMNGENVRGVMNGHALPVPSRRSKETPDDDVAEEVDDKSTPADESFVNEFRAVAISEDQSRELEIRAREEIAAQSDPVAETQAIMDVDNPYARVLRAANTVRAGRRVDKSGLHFLKK